MTLRARNILLIALAGLLVVTGLSMVVGPFSIASLESRLESNARAALDRREMDWAHVRFRGQEAIVSGAAPNDTAREIALEVVAGSTWSGGSIAGGVTHVVDEITDARTDRGFSFRADVAFRGRVLIRGDATDAAARDAIARFATANFPNGADSDLTLIPGGAPAAEWEEAAKRLLGQLARLERGAIVLSGQQGGLYGDAENPQIARSVANTLQSMPAPFRAASIIIPAGAPAIVNVPDIEACAAVIRAAQGTDALRFETGGVGASPLTEIALRRLGRTFGACPDNARLSVTINIADGGEELARQRAEQVRSLLSGGAEGESRVIVALADDQLQALTFSVSSIEG
ncbi:hypothetical protein [Maricaulis sp.]|uniref:hypothetical protein n=1 Tax=Maricaulis sp. TaxID=1486257 RepID=UPI003A91781B